MVALVSAGELSVALFVRGGLIVTALLFLHYNQQQNQEQRCIAWAITGAVASFESLGSVR